MSEIFVGIDVSKDTLDVCLIPAQERFRVTTGEKDLQKLAGRLARVKPTLIVMEATGGLETRVAAALWAQQLPVSVVNPRQVRDFARALNILAKTDAIDACVLAQFADRIRPEPRPLATEEERALKELVARRRQLIDAHTAELNRKYRASSKRVYQSIQKVLDTLEREIAAIDDEIDRLIKQSPIWREKDELLRSVPGVGKTTARTLITEMPELGHVRRGGAASLAGLAPMNRDSGKFKGKRTIVGGRPAVRKALYFPTLAAIRSNPQIRAFHKRLKEAGKTNKVAITACMRKLLTILNAMMRKNQHWSPQIS